MDRKKTIQVFEDMKRGLYPMYPDEYLDAAIEALSAEPCEDTGSSEKPNKWIPVNERLPEVKYDSLGNNISDYVLLWVKKGDYETYKIGYFSPPNCFDAITSDGWFISVCALKDVIAWMPLPEPYMSENPTGSNSEEESEDT